MTMNRSDVGQRSYMFEEIIRPPFGITELLKRQFGFLRVDISRGEFFNLFCNFRFNSTEI